MAWIKSYQSLERHPKLLELMTSLDVNQSEAIGLLHRFWWWCVDYAEDGDLARFSNEQIAGMLGLGKDKPFIETMVKCGFIERKPYLRIHDWIDYVGEYLYSKYRSSNLKKYKSIVRAYKGGHKGGHKYGLDLDKIDIDKIDKINIKTYADIIAHFNLVCKKSLALTDPRKKIIAACLKLGRTPEQINQAITNFSKDTWEGRSQHCDLIYAIGVRNKVDNFDKWMDYKPVPGTGGSRNTKISPHHPKASPGKYDNFGKPKEDIKKPAQEETDDGEFSKEDPTKVL
jgi:hypothetical protein